MKKINLKAAALMLMLVFSAQANAQSILDNLKDALGGGKDSSSSSASSALSSVVSSLFGSKVSDEALDGTWSYTAPAVIFESDNLLKKAGGSIASSTVENKLQSYLTRFGITAGNMKMTFNSKDKTFSTVVKSKTISGTYTLNESEITLSYKGGSKGITGNVGVSGNTLEITFHADKLLTFLSAVGSKTGNASISTISKLAGSYDGMQLGFKYKKVD